MTLSRTQTLVVFENMTESEPRERERALTVGEQEISKNNS